MSEPTREPQYEGFIASDHIGYNVEDGGNSNTVTIAEVKDRNTVKDAAGKIIDREVVYFVNRTRGLILNATNTRAIALLYGKERSGWIGNKVTLTVKFINAFGEKDVPTIRIQPPEGLPLPFGMRKWMGKDRPQAKPLTKKDLA